MFIQFSSILLCMVNISSASTFRVLSWKPFIGAGTKRWKKSFLVELGETYTSVFTCFRAWLASRNCGDTWRVAMNFAKRWLPSCRKGWCTFCVVLVWEVQFSQAANSFVAQDLSCSPISTPSVPPPPVYHHMLAPPPIWKSKVWTVKFCSPYWVMFPCWLITCLCWSLLANVIDVCQTSCFIQDFPYESFLTGYTSVQPLHENLIPLGTRFYVSWFSDKDRTIVQTLGKISRQTICSVLCEHFGCKSRVWLCTKFLLLEIFFGWRCI